MQEKEYPPVPPIDPGYFRDMDWAYANYANLAAEYPNQWVAVVDGRVAAAGANLSVVEEEAIWIAGWRDIAVLFVERGIYVYGHSALGSIAS
jgi:hypothetical protein